MEAIKFFYRNLNIYLLGLLGLSVIVNIQSYHNFLELDKKLTINFQKILATESDEFHEIMFMTFIDNVLVLMIYAFTLLMIQIIGRRAITNAVNKTADVFLDADLTKISKTDYENKLTSIIYHRENLFQVINNLLIEFPRKTIACLHFVNALYTISYDIMFYCIVINCVFILITSLVTFIRKSLNATLIEINTKFSVICSDVANSIQVYKVDNRINEYKEKIHNVNNNNLTISSIDSVLVAFNDSFSDLSAQIAVIMIAYLCRPMIFNKTISPETLTYGLKSSTKFIEKLNGVSEYIGNIIRQYGSFVFFNQTNKIVCSTSDIFEESTIDSIQIKINNATHTTCRLNQSNYFRIAGSNGVGKTTMLFEFMGVNFKGSLTSGTMIGLLNGKTVLANKFKNSICFVQQIVPFTYDTVTEYVYAVTKSKLTIKNLFDETCKILKLNDNIKNHINELFSGTIQGKYMRELSGGQSKIIQFITAVMKMVHNNYQIMILDEPTNNLDVTKVEIVKDIIRSIIYNGRTVFIITHDNRLLNDIEHDTVTLY
jgi:putative ABC transport system ATP-binding protein